MSKEQKIKAAFATEKEVESLYTTSDGQCFKKEGNAYSHAKTLEDSTVEELDRKLKPVKKEEATTESGNAGGSESGGSTTKLTAEERIAKINKAETVDQVNELLEGEKAKTVKAAGAAKIEALQADEEKDLIAKIQESEDLEYLNAFVAEGNNSSEAVVTAVNARIKELGGDK